MVEEADLDLDLVSALAVSRIVAQYLADRLSVCVASKAKT